MKKLILLTVLALALLIGCTDSTPAATPGETQTPANTPSAPDTSPDEPEVSPGLSGERQGFLFKAYGQEIYVCLPAAPILAALPEPDDIFEAPSCAFEGVDITYFFSGFELTTYPENGAEHILSVLFTDDSIATPGGVYLGGTLTDMERAYGTDHVQNGPQYIYSNGRGSLIFTFQGEHIIGIFYTMIIGD
jgi:hypothetical protein